jgi:TRAP-type mannitol/chloroaromatic compound transport system permease small subunit
VLKLLAGGAIACTMAVVVFLALRLGERLLPVTRIIDRISQAAGLVATVLVLTAVLISAGNALSRYAFSASSNAWLEIQWYMFAGTVLLGAAETFRRNQHVRVDLIYGSVSQSRREWIDLLGGVVFLMPVCLIMIYFTWPVFLQSWRLGEMSSSAGGLIRWPVQLLLPVGFGLLALQGVAEIIKRGAALSGAALKRQGVEDIEYTKPLQ